MDGDAVPHGYLSQWSLTFEVRKRPWQHHKDPTPKLWSQWSLTFEVRKSDACSD